MNQNREQFYFTQDLLLNLPQLQSSSAFESDSALKFLK